MLGLPVRMSSRNFPAEGKWREQGPLTNDQLKLKCGGNTAELTRHCAPDLLFHCEWDPLVTQAISETKESTTSN